MSSGETAFIHQNTNIAAIEHAEQQPQLVQQRGRLLKNLGATFSAMTAVVSVYAPMLAHAESPNDYAETTENIYPEPKAPAGASMRFKSGNPGETKVLNVTVTEPEGAGFVTVYPCSEGAPLASSLNFKRGETVANAVITRADAEGYTCILPSVATYLVVDDMGSGGTINAYKPVRAVDTRDNNGKHIPAGQDVVVHASDTPGTVVVGNVTAVDPLGSGFFTVYPCSEGIPNPLTSNVNFVKGQIVANAFAAPTDSEGNVCVRSNVDAHMVVDLSGEGTLPTQNPQRLQDTRLSGGKLPAGALLPIIVTETPGESVVLNLTATEPDRPGFAAVFPCEEGYQGTSNANFAAGQTVANMVATKADKYGKVCIIANTPTHVVVDLQAKSGINAQAPKRIVDLRVFAPGITFIEPAPKDHPCLPGETDVTRKVGVYLGDDIFKIPIYNFIDYCAD